MSTSSTTPDLTTEIIPTGFTPSQEQLDDLARRLMPEIKKYFADGQVQAEFAAWLAKKNAA